MLSSQDNSRGAWTGLGAVLGLRLGLFIKVPLSSKLKGLATCSTVGEA